MINKITIVFFFLITASLYSQQLKIENYKYIIVADKFEFLKKTNQYQTSSLTKFLLQKNGFEVFLSNETFPVELSQNRCLALNANVIDDSGIFTVKSRIELKDCFGKVVYTSKIGKSKEKDYKKGYHQAIRNAYDSMTDLRYSSQRNDGLKEIISTEVVSKIEVPVKLENSRKKKVLEKEKTAIDNVSKKEVLYAQAKENGFQLVNTKPEVVFQILRTKNKDLYLIKDENGILYKTASGFTAEYYEGNKLVLKEYTIKF